MIFGDAKQGLNKAIHALSLWFVIAMAPVTAAPKNIIIMIGDGMGPAYTSAYRYYQDDPTTGTVETSVFDRLLVGMASTYPVAGTGYITDSAAAATALATGVKSYNGAISVDQNKRPLKTLFESAKHYGKKTGVVVTSQVNHATPAAFISHNESRRNYLQIAQSYLDSDTDVILGGGQRYFSPELLTQFRKKGYQTLTQFDQLDTIRSNKVLGLFADVQLPWAIDTPTQHHLSQLTQTALSQLETHPQGFVLLIEGSLIDWAGHDNDIATAMAEVSEFANAVAIAEQYVQNHPDTLLVATADHSTGGLTIAANGEYAWRPQLLTAMTKSPDRIAELALTNTKGVEFISTELGIPLTENDIVIVTHALSKGKKQLAKAIRTVIDHHTNTGWTGDGHTGIDVQVFAAGTDATLFHGFQDNTDIAKKLIGLLH